MLDLEGSKELKNNVESSSSKPTDSILQSQSYRTFMKLKHQQLEKSKTTNHSQID